jgi:Spy/CpxP family protein refolding chaperone
MSGDQPQRRDLQGELTRQRQELFSLLKQDSPSWPEIQGKIKEISTRQGKLEEETVRLLMESMKCLTSEQRAGMFPLLERRLNPPRFRGGGRARENKL